MSRTAVTPEPNAHFDSKVTEEWLDGLAGRSGGSPAALEGAALRGALNVAQAENATNGAPAWADIVSAAERPGVALAGKSAGEAANLPRWRRLAAGGFAVIVIGVGLSIWGLGREPDAGGLGMRGSATPGGAVWLTDDPEQAANVLADRLKSIGATVAVTAEPKGTRLDIACGAASAELLNEQLSSIEAAVDTSCKLSLHVARVR